MLARTATEGAREVLATRPGGPAGTSSSAAGIEIRIFFCSCFGSDTGLAADRGLAEGFGLADSALVGTGLVDGLTGESALVGTGLADSALVGTGLVDGLTGESTRVGTGFAVGLIGSGITIAFGGGITTGSGLICGCAGGCGGGFNCGLTRGVGSGGRLALLPGRKIFRDVVSSAARGSYLRVPARTGP